MVFGLGKSSHQSWTPCPYPAVPPTMLVTGVPTYSAASPYYLYSPQSAIPASPMIMPMQVAVQSPVVQIPPPATTYTVFQPAPSVPSPVIRASITMPPANPPPVRAPPSPRPRPPQPIGDGANALMLFQTPQQAPHSSPSNVNINLYMTPQLQPMESDAVVQDQSVSSPLFSPFFEV